MDELREQLAAIEHERWASWQTWMHARCERYGDGSLLIPAELVARWERQIATPYAELSEAEKRSDREQVDRYWPLIAEAARKAAALDALCHMVNATGGMGRAQLVTTALMAELLRRQWEEADHA